MYNSNLIQEQINSFVDAGQYRIGLHRKQFSMHELMLYYCDVLSGDISSITLSTFSIGEEFGRSVHIIREGNPGVNLVCVFDHSIKANKKDFLFFSSGAIDQVYFNSIHAKLLIIESSTGEQVMIHSSANFTPNPRWECTYISSNKAIIELMKLQYGELIKDSELYDL